MNVEKLSKRLTHVVNHISNGAKIADIGSDHAYLPCYAVRNGITTFAIAGEVVKGPFLSAQKQVNDSGLQEYIQVRLGDGLDVISPNEVDCITIAGMGGKLITSILEKGKEKLEGVSKLVLQPNVGAHAIRRWLIENEWELKTEEILEEDDKIYEILVAEKGDPQNPYSIGEHRNVELLLGPFLIKEKNNVFKKKWEKEIEKWENVLSNIEKGDINENLLKKKEEMNWKINVVKEELGFENH